MRAWILLLALYSPAWAAPTLTAIESAGSKATLTGSEFGARPQVFFGNAEAKVIEVQPTRLIVEVPADAPKHCSVTVESDGVRSNGQAFQCSPRIILSVGKNPLGRGETTTGTFRVLHEDQPITLSFSNATPEVVTFQGGEQQTVRTSGGSNNCYEFTIVGKSGSRLYQVDYRWGAQSKEVEWTLPWSKVDTTRKL